MVVDSFLPFCFPAFFFLVKKLYWISGLKKETNYKIYKLDIEARGVRIQLYWEKGRKSRKGTEEKLWHQYQKPSQGWLCPTWKDKIWRDTISIRITQVTLVSGKSHRNRTSANQSMLDPTLISAFPLKVEKHFTNDGKKMILHFCPKTMLLDYLSRR